MFETSVGALPRTYTWYEVWRDVLLRPTQETFGSVLADPKASSKRAYLWVAVAGVVGGLLEVIAVEILRGFGREVEVGTLMLLGRVILAVIGAVVGLMFQAGIGHWLAKKFGGQGTGDNLAYLFGAVSAPISLLTSFVNALAALLLLGEGANQEMVALIISTASLALTGYMLILYVQAVRAGEQLSVGKAILTVLIPAMVVFAFYFVQGFLQMFSD